MPTGPFGGPRPFASDETIKVGVSISDSGNFNVKQFDSLLGSFNATIQKPVDTRFIAETSELFVDTGIKNIAFESLDDVIDDVERAVDGAGGGELVGVTFVSSQNFADARS